MPAFPALNQEDIDYFDRSLRELLTKSEANVALLVEKAGYLIHQCGNPEQLIAKVSKQGLAMHLAKKPRRAKPGRQIWPFLAGD